MRKIDRIKQAFKEHEFVHEGERLASVLFSGRVYIRELEVDNEVAICLANWIQGLYKEEEPTIPGDPNM